MAQCSRVWTLHGHPGPLLATAIHDGHELRPDVVPWIALDARARLREEDPFTRCWTSVGDVRLVVHRSRFEVDLNRPRHAAIYRTPADAWGLTVWRPQVPDAVFDASLRIYDAFYRRMARVLELLTAQHRQVIVLDLHSYNHRREGPDTCADEAGNPDINLGTGSLDRARWQRVVDSFLRDASRGVVQGRQLSVGENVKFKGGYFSTWINTLFPGRACALAVEVKKIFMNEWTGRADDEALAAVGRVLAGAAGNLRRELGRSAAA